MISYRFLSNGRVHYSYPKNLESAFRVAARDHEAGKTVDQIMDENRKYNRQEILTICKRLGLLR